MPLKFRELIKNLEIAGFVDRGGGSPEEFWATMWRKYNPIWKARR